MTWQRYDLIFRLQSPLHIGFRKVGNLMQTRRYVPGKNLWAALTERLTRMAFLAPAFRDYEGIGEALRTYFRFGYLYPALKEGERMRVYYPWQDARHFDYRFLDSYASTALAGADHAAAAGALHEVEFIRPYARPLGQELSQPVYLKGVLYVQPAWPSDSPLAAWQKALARIQMGGERSYGWGRLRLVSPLKGEQAPKPEWDVSEGEYARAHVLAPAGAGVEGLVEPLVGWERGDPDQGRYWRLTPRPLVAYQPGSKMTQPLHVTLHAWGMWEVAS